MKRLIKILAHLVVMLFIGLLYIPVFAQEPVAETIYMHTDRTVYTAGETIHYKLYLLDAATQRRSNLSKVGYVLLRAAYQSPIIKCRVGIDSGISTGSIVLPDTLPSGLYQLVAFTNSMKNRAEKPFFRNEIVIVNSFDKDFNFKLPVANNNDVSNSLHNLLKITTNKTIYGTREKVVVSFDKVNLKANLSVSVSEDSNIPTLYNSILETLRKQGNQALNKPISTDYFPEKSGKILRGKVLDAVTGQNIDKAIVLLSCVDTVPNLQYALTNSNGTFQMLLGDYYEGKELFLTVRDMPANQHWKIEIEDEFAQSEIWKPALKYDSGNYKAFLTKTQNIAYINSSYESDKDTITNQSATIKVICPQFYNCPTRSVLLADYTPLNDFKEIVVELLPEVRITKDNGKYNVSMLNGTQKMVSESSTVAIFLDGVYVDDAEKIMKLGSEQIQKIDVINAERVFGNLIFRGVISIVTKSNEIEKTIPGFGSLRIRNDRISNPDTYVVDKTDTLPNRNFPFFRQLLYWNPNLEIKEQEQTSFDFFTSDNEGNFLIRIEGVSNDGQPISYSSTIQVVKQSKSTEK